MYNCSKIKCHLIKLEYLLKRGKKMETAYCIKYNKLHKLFLLNFFKRMFKLMFIEYFVNLIL